MHITELAQDDGRPSKEMVHRRLNEDGSPNPEQPNLYHPADAIDLFTSCCGQVVKNSKILKKPLPLAKVQDEVFAMGVKIKGMTNG